MTDEAFARTKKFYGLFGLFYSAWSAAELNIDLTIGKLLGTAPAQTHALLAGMQFGRKAALLRALLSKSDYANASELKGYLTGMQRKWLRNVFTHSYIFSDMDSVTFVHRSSDDDHSKIYKFKADDFISHIKAFTQHVTDFEKALAIPQDARQQFAKAGLKPPSETL